jgi:hypothetical protein
VPPKRLLYVGNQTQPPRLVETAGITEYYITLSHCWGHHQPLRTTRSTLSQHLNEIPFDGLPQTFKDAVILARNLQIRFLWIDSLCIIQDDEDDWATESVRMGLIYEAAILTIAAASAADSSVGLFRDRERFGIEIPYLDEDGEERGTAIAHQYHHDMIKNAIKTCPLNSRAWVYQESYFSRRTVHFLDNTLVWSCKGGDTRHIGVHQCFWSDFDYSWRP